MPSPPLTIRPLLAADQDALWNFLHIALWDPPPATLRPREVIFAPNARIYAEDWGRDSDIGVAGQLPGVAEAIGACWMRVIRGRQGLGYIDDETPQLGISLLPAYQGKGYGHQLMLAALDAARQAGIKQVSLTVHPENPARLMYARCGFVRLERTMAYHLMAVTL